MSDLPNETSGTSPPDDLVPDDLVPDELAPAESARSAQPPRSNKRFWWVVVLVVLVPLAAIFSLFLVARVTLGEKVIIYPGGTFDVEDRIEIVGDDFYPSPGEIRLVTVRSNFNPSIFELVVSWFDQSWDVLDHEDVLGERTVEENREVGQLQMTNSSEVAVRVALQQLGYDVFDSVGVLILSAQPDSAAEDVLTAGDVVVAVDGTPTLTVSEFVEAVRRHVPGDEIQLTIASPDSTGPDSTGPDNTGPAATETVTATLGEREGAAFLGVQITDSLELRELPVEVELDLGSIGGPSAGLAICLSVIDSLTEEELTAGLDVVATGTINPDGSIGRVGGVEQKAHAVLQTGADLMLVPAGQVDQANSVLDGYIDVVGVETLEQALEAIASRR